MKVAIPYEAGQVFGHFGHSAAFMVYEIEAGKVVSSTLLPTNGSGHGALAGLLAANKVNALICGGIGGGARNALAEAGIQLYGGVSGNADQAVEALLKGELTFDPDAHCDHHDHGEHHGSCGGHGHGEGHGSCGGHGHGEGHGSCGSH